jgi:hypothetical protein
MDFSQPMLEYFVCETISSSTFICETMELMLSVVRR